MAPQPSGGAPSRERLLRAAKRLFGARGYEQTATSTIAREAGTSESQLMRYFGGKQGLLQALFDDAWADLDARLRPAAETPGTARDVILELAQTLASALARDPDLAMLLLFEGRRLRGGRPRIRLSEGYVRFVETIRTVVRKGQSAREIDRSLDPGAVASSIVGAVEAMLRDRLIARTAGGRTFAEREVQRTLDALLAGIAAAPGRTRRRAT